MSGMRKPDVILRDIDDFHTMKMPAGIYGNKEMYVITVNTITPMSDMLMARDLKMSTWHYREHLRENFNALIDNDYHPTTSIFETRKDAKKAIDWIESILLMRYLTVEQK